jgi:hypothetical protein
VKIEFPQKTRNSGAGVERMNVGVSYICCAWLLTIGIRDILPTSMIYRES